MRYSLHNQRFRVRTNNVKNVDLIIRITNSISTLLDGFEAVQQTLFQFPKNWTIWL